MCCWWSQRTLDKRLHYWAAVAEDEFDGQEENDLVEENWGVDMRNRDIWGRYLRNWGAASTGIGKYHLWARRKTWIDGGDAEESERYACKGGESALQEARNLFTGGQEKHRKTENKSSEGLDQDWRSSGWEIVERVKVGTTWRWVYQLEQDFRFVLSSVQALFDHPKSTDCKPDVWTNRLS